MSFVKKTSIVAIIFLFIESFMRNNYPQGDRPSTLITAIANFLSGWATLLGFYLARFTDFYKFIKEVICDDVIALVESIFEIFKVPSHFLTGYIDYYASSVTPLGVAIFTLVLVVLLVCWWFAYYPTNALSYVASFVHLVDFDEEKVDDKNPRGKRASKPTT
jgi:hypothetical protein